MSIGFVGGMEEVHPYFLLYCFQQFSSYVLSGFDAGVQTLMIFKQILYLLHSGLDKLLLPNNVKSENIFRTCWFVECET